MLITKSKTCYFNRIKFPYISALVVLFARIYDTLDDYTEITSNITLEVNENLNIEEFALQLESSLTSTLVPDLPAQLAIQILTILNRDENVLGKFYKSSNQTLDSQLASYLIISDYLNLYINSSISESSIESSAQILNLMNRNPFISSESTFNSTLTIFGAIIKSSETNGLSSEVGSTLFESLSKTLYFTSAENSTTQLSKYQDSINLLTQRIDKNMLLGENYSMVSGKVSLDIKKVAFVYSDFSMKSSGEINAKTVIPKEFFESSQASSFTLALGYTKTSSSSNISVVDVTVFNENGIYRPILKDSYFEIQVPHKNTSDVETPVCVFLNISQLWNDSGCIVKEVNSIGITCLCSHLTSFSAGDLDGGFFPSNNIAQTVDPKSLENLTKTSAIGFYFAAIVLTLFFFIGVLSLKKDKKDL